MAANFADDIFNRIFVNENVWILIQFSLKFVLKDPIKTIPTLVQIMAWRRLDDKPLFEWMVVSLLTYICVTRPQWVNTAFMFGRGFLLYYCNTLINILLVEDFCYSTICGCVIPSSSTVSQDADVNDINNIMSLWVNIIHIWSFMQPPFCRQHFQMDFLE